MSKRPTVCCMPEAGLSVVVSSARAHLRAPLEPPRRASASTHCKRGRGKRERSKGGRAKTGRTPTGGLGSIAEGQYSATKSLRFRGTRVGAQESKTPDPDFNVEGEGHRYPRAGGQCLATNSDWLRPIAICSLCYLCRLGRRRCSAGQLTLPGGLKLLDFPAATVR